MTHSPSLALVVRDSLLPMQRADNLDNVDIVLLPREPYAGESAQVRVVASQPAGAAEPPDGALTADAAQPGDSSRDIEYSCAFPDGSVSAFCEADQPTPHVFRQPGPTAVFVRLRSGQELSPRLVRVRVQDELTLFPEPGLPSGPPVVISRDDGDAPTIAIPCADGVLFWQLGRHDLSSDAYFVRLTDDVCS